MIKKKNDDYHATVLSIVSEHPLPVGAGKSLDFHENIDKAETCLVYRSIHTCVYIFYRYNMEVGSLK